MERIVSSFFSIHDSGNHVDIATLLKDKEDSSVLVLGEEKEILLFREVLGEKKVQIYLHENRDIQRESRKFQKKFYLVGGTAARVIDHIRRNHADFKQFKWVTAFLPEKKEQLDSFMGDISFILSRLQGVSEVYYLSPYPLQRKDHPLLKKSIAVSLKRRQNRKEKVMAKIPENIIAAMDDLIKKTKGDKEPEKLSEYRKIFKKSVPFGFRGWVTAFLLREYLSKDRSLKMPLLKEGISIFVGIGKNRKVYPKDLIHLFINTGKVERGQIGEIRILDNYAFVSIEKTSADKAIDNLNGINYRGRNLNVNYAKQK